MGKSIQHKAHNNNRANRTIQRVPLVNTYHGQIIRKHMDEGVKKISTQVSMDSFRGT